MLEMGASYKGSSLALTGEPYNLALALTLAWMSVTLQCASYSPEDAGASASYKGGWGITCASVRDVDSDVKQRDLVLTPPSQTVGASELQTL
jgi:hypothetical protein